MLETNKLNHSIFKKFIGKDVIITLSNNSIFHGILISIDGYMNLAIKNLKINGNSSDNIFKDNFVKGCYELACLRGACVERITLK